MNVEDTVRAARAAGKQLARLGGAARAALLEDLAVTLRDKTVRETVLAANARDVAEAEGLLRKGELSAALVKRLVLDASKLDGLADGLRQLAAARDLVGRVLVTRELDTGLVLRQVSAPLGVLGVVFESRPDALPQISGLALKSGNAVVLKGGREALHSNRALVECLHRVVQKHGVAAEVISLLEDRAQVDAMLRLDDLIDLVVARGSGAFVEHIRANTHIAVLGHAEGLCHLLLHAPLSAEMAARIAVDAKTSYPSACNAIETLLWTPGSEAALHAALDALRAAQVELRACPRTRALHPALKAASDADWDAEYGDLILAVKGVDDLDAALAHIERHGSKHTEVIVTDDTAAAARFVAEVDAAGVFHNASSRFADGYRYGLGAEVGISTGKLHARGPVGVEGLLTTRWLLEGHGQVASDYGPGKKPFTHKDL